MLFLLAKLNNSSGSVKFWSISENASQKSKLFISILPLGMSVRWMIFIICQESLNIDQSSTWACAEVIFKWSKNNSILTLWFLMGLSHDIIAIYNSLPSLSPPGVGGPGGPGVDWAGLGGPFSFSGDLMGLWHDIIPIYNAMTSYLFITHFHLPLRAEGPLLGGPQPCWWGALSFNKRGPYC